MMEEYVEKPIHQDNSEDIRKREDTNLNLIVNSMIY